MSVFQVIPDAYAISVTGGVYHQTDVYERDGLLYIKVGSGFARLIRGAGASPKIVTSKPSTYIDELVVNSYKLGVTTTGTVCTDKCKLRKANL